MARLANKSSTHVRLKLLCPFLELIRRHHFCRSRDNGHAGCWCQVARKIN